MDTRVGKIYTSEEIEEMRKAIRKIDLVEFITSMQVPPTEKQMARKPPKVGRNEPCPCGSGKKFKKCCLTKP